jgi:hypothetical protein
MDDIIDISTINLNENLSDDWNRRSRSNKGSNFGSGIELLMNDKKKENSGRQANDIDLEDLNNLEDELNNLADNDSNSNLFESRSDLFNSNVNFNDKPSVRFDDPSTHNINIGQATAEADSEGSTWDGYTKFNNIPVNPDKPLPQQPQMTKEELLREKFKYLRKLEALEQKGVTLTKKYSMESPLAEMQGEYEMIMEEKARQNSVKFSGNMLMACINGIEFLNNRFDPFDIKIDGWSDQVNENLNDYDDVFAELYDKYKSRASMAPELKLLFQLGGSAMMVHMTNTMFKSAMPGMDDILRQNPDLMRQFQSAAVNSMSQSSPGLSGFMNNMMESPGNQGPPPPPMATQHRESHSSRPGNNSSSKYSNSRPTFGENDGINIRENFANASESSRSNRSEMKGPSDISDILNGLKTKTINIQEVPQQSMSQNHQGQGQGNDSSTISISELKELQGEGNIPKRSKRRQNSDKNTVSLDI